MAHRNVAVGIDVSKDTLDVALLPRGEFLQFSNDRSGLRALVSVLRRKEASLVAFEATGGYEKGLLRALTKLAASRINPQRVREFAKACGVMAKNDRIGAAMIARFAATLAPRLTVSNVRIEAPAELVTTRRQVIDDITRVGNQSAQTTQALIKRLALRRLRQLTVHLEALDLAIANMVADDTDFARDDALLQSMLCVGPVVSHTLLALMPELGKLDDREIAAPASIDVFAPRVPPGIARSTRAADGGGAGSGFTQAFARLAPGGAYLRVPGGTWRTLAIIASAPGRIVGACRRLACLDGPASGEGKKGAGRNHACRIDPIIPPAANERVSPTAELGGCRLSNQSDGRRTNRHASPFLYLASAQGLPDRARAGLRSVTHSRPRW
jgi:transposase